MGLARVLMAVMVLGLIGANPAFADSPVPAGLRVVNRAAVAPGVERFTLERDTPPLVVNVARIAPNAAVSLRAVLSNAAVFTA